jgi:hypothetical protein
MAPNDQANRALFTGILIGLLLDAQAKRKDMPFNDVRAVTDEDGNYGYTVKVNFGDSWWDIDVMPGEAP